MEEDKKSDEEEEVTLCPICDGEGFHIVGCEMREVEKGD